jgi:transcriptional regulator with XRE-family HTH domain
MSSKSSKANTNTSSKILDRLEEFLSLKGETMSTLVCQLGVSRGYFSSTRRMGSELGIDKIVRILQLYPDLSADWLLLGIGLMVRNASLKNLNEHLNLIEREKKLREAKRDLVKIQELVTDLQTRMEVNK